MTHRLWPLAFAPALALSVLAGSDPRAQAPPVQTREMQAAPRRLLSDPWRVAPSSPLAANRMVLFAVAEDGVTIIRQNLVEGGPWQPMLRPEMVRRVTGLAATNEALYVADAGEHLIVEVKLETGEASPVARLSRQLEPGDLAFSDALYFTDRASSHVFRVASGREPSSSGEPVMRVSPDNAPPAGSPLFLTTSGDLLIVSSPDDGTVWQGRTGKAGGAAAWSLLLQPSRELPGPSLPATTDVKVARGVSFALRPTALAAYSGVIYVVDANSNGVFAYSRYWPRPVRLAFGPLPVAHPTRLVATEGHLIILDGERGDVVRWPRFVPTRINCAVAGARGIEPPSAIPCVGSQYGELSAVFSYLHEQQFLPMKPLQAEGGLDAAVRQAYPILTMTRMMTHIACALRSAPCTRQGDAFLMPRGDPQAIAVPDVYGESYVDATGIRLIGGRTLGEEADAALPSPQFSLFATESGLADLNGGFKPGIAFRDLSSGYAMVPVELVRFVVGIPAGQHRLLASRFRGVTFLPLGEAAASRASVKAQEPATLADLEAAYKRMRASIGGAFEVEIENIPYVGVAEADIDLMNPEIAEAFPESMAPVHTGAAPLPAGGDEFEIRAYRDGDHGNAVAALIGARTWRFGGAALAAGAPLLQINDAEPTIGDSIRHAFVTQRARIFNLSFHFGKENIPGSLREAIDQYQQALFVVAAGNDTVTGPDGKVCATFQAYPVCWGDKQNVLVVTATTLDGTTLLPPDTGTDPVTPGANWNPAVVHVAAPGADFYSSGRGRSYVKVRGSSFAAPLVTAAAALIYGQGVRSPWEIKQRIIATADQVADLDGRVLAGRLNAKRAATNLSVAVVIDELGRESALWLHEAGASIPFQTATENFTVNASDIRRLTRLGGGQYRLVYLSGDTLQWKTVRQTRWPFRYFERDAQGHRSNRVRQGDLSNYKDYIGPISW